MIINKSYSVQKFGGSSLADANKFKAIKSLLAQKNEIVVVSATQGTTSALQAIMDCARNGEDYIKALDLLEEKHVSLIRELFLGEQHDELEDLIQNDVAKMRDILYAILLTGSYSTETQSLILGHGELWSARILKHYLDQFNKVAFLDASKVLFVYEKEGVICIDWEQSKASLIQYLRDIDFNQLVITGFIASTLDGQLTTLGRNGSDFSAAIFANLFSAKSLTIWTDVDGIYTADPNLVRSALVIDSLSYKEALELAYFGAKVLHPMTIAPVVEQQIPIYIKNSFNPEAKGTYISSEVDNSSQLIKGISCIEQVALINIEGSGLISVSGITSRVADILHRSNIHVLLISQASSEHSICLAVSTALADKAMNALTVNLQAEIERKHIEGIYADPGCAILSVVGDEMIGVIGITGKLFTALARAQVNIRAISQGSSERNISVVIKNADVSRAMQAVHSGFYLSRKTLSIGLIGPGSVAKSFLQQLNQSLEQVSDTYQVNIGLRAILNSQKMLLAESSLNLQLWPQLFAEKAVEADLDSFMEHLVKDKIQHAVLIDCTASKIIAQRYLDFMARGIHVITPNKHANAGDLAYYQQLKALSRYQNYYFYEATVCAGLPVINTLQDLIKTGDEIETIEGVVSGTLSYIFNEMAKGRSFSAVVLDAKNRGFTEPDPREDLSGMDVARKLVCLAREVGHEVTLDDVAVYDLVPPELKSCSIEEFMDNLAHYDHTMNVWMEKAEATKQRLHYVGRVSQDGKLQVALQLLPEAHPFSGLEGTDNMLIFRTRRYHERPLVIQGPGAGAEVTAAGVFADLLRLIAVLS